MPRSPPLQTNASWSADRARRDWLVGPGGDRPVPAICDPLGERSARLSWRQLARPTAGRRADRSSCAISTQPRCVARQHHQLTSATELRCACTPSSGTCCCRARRRAEPIMILSPAEDGERGAELPGADDCDLHAARIRLRQAWRRCCTSASATTATTLRCRGRRREQAHHQRRSRRRVRLVPPRSCRTCRSAWPFTARPRSAADPPRRGRCAPAASLNRPREDRAHADVGGRSARSGSVRLAERFTVPGAASLPSAPTEHMASTSSAMPRATNHLQVEAAC